MSVFTPLARPELETFLAPYGLGRLLDFQGIAAGSENTNFFTSLEQGEQMKRVSSWAAILFAPSLIGGVYGMNFTHMPELDWRYGYPMALAMMLILALILFTVFRRKGWL